MTEKEKLFEELIKKSGKSREELEKLVSDKVNELSGLVSEEGAIYIIANEMEIRLDTDRPKRELNQLKIDEITQPKTPVSSVCKVVKKYDKVNFSKDSGSEGSVQSILVGDETGVIRVVFWNDKTELLDSVQEGDILKIINAYARENTNSERIEVHFGQYSDIEVNPQGVEIEVKEFVPEDIEFEEKKVTEINEGDKNIKIAGVITTFDIPRYYLGCPECYKKVFQDEGTYKCAMHDEVEAMRIPIVNIVVDDGSGNISVVGFRDRAQDLTKLDKEKLLELTEDIDKYNEFSKSIVGSKVELGGNTSLSPLTGENQILVNQVMSLDLKEIDELAKEIISEDEKETSQESESDNEDKKNKTEKESDFLDDEDLDIEEIDFNDDLM